MIRLRSSEIGLVESQGQRPVTRVTVVWAWSRGGTVGSAEQHVTEI